MKERQSYQLAALGAGLMLLVMVMTPFTGFINELLGLYKAWWVVGMLVPALLDVAAWLLLIPFMRMVRVRFHEQPRLWRYGMTAVVLVLVSYVLTGVQWAFPVEQGDYSHLSGPVLLVYVRMLVRIAALLLFSYFFTLLFTFCRRVQSRSALTFLPMAAAFLLLLNELTGDFGFFAEQPAIADHAVYVVRLMINWVFVYISYILLLVYFSVNIFKARS